MKSRYWGENKKHEKSNEYNSWRDPHEGIWIDCPRFQHLFLTITPWGGGEMSDTLARRCFKV